MSTKQVIERTHAQKRRLAALWKRLERDEARTQVTRDAINKFLDTERIKLLPVSTDD